MDSELFHDTSLPRVSVVMAVNRIDTFLGPAMESILKQTFKDFEFLIIVDASCPRLVDRILELGAGDERIKLLMARLGGGLAFSLNLGIAESKGEYIARMDGDDVSRSNRLQEQVLYLDKNKDVAVVGCRVQLIDANSEKITRNYPYFQTNEQIRRVLPFRNPLPHPALMFRKSALLAVQGYKYGHFSEDHEMFIRMARDPQVRFYSLDQVLFEYRRHGLQATRPDRMKWHYAEIS
ncbi:MAG: glycosyltransferase [Acidobacteriaceae bacterium]